MNPLERLRLATGQDVTLATLMDRLADVNDDSRLVEEAESGLTLSYREAANALQVREATITTRLFRARLRLAQALSGQEEEADQASRSRKRLGPEGRT